MELTDEQWLAVEPFIPAAERGPPGRKGGRPWVSARNVLNGVLWVLRTGAPWADLPERYPPYQTCHRRFQRWVAKGTLPKVLAALRRDLEERGGKRPSRRKQDGRALRRYKRRWRVERLFAWLKRWRRLATRWEYKAENFLGLLHLGCIVLLLRKLHPSTR
jgi:transposase